VKKDNKAIKALTEEYNGVGVRMAAFWDYLAGFTKRKSNI
jgi:hypothetical protein